jgi:dihydrofolate synthase/folylpolyglutamate synthase
MGGRLDATNILNPLVSVITLIELEHTEYLGLTLTDIAAEKAGIIKPGRPLVLAEQEPRVLELFRQKAASLGSPLIYFPEAAAIKNLRISRRGTDFTLTIKLPGQPEAYINQNQNPTSNPNIDLFVPIPGEVQAQNAGLAVLALKTILPGLALQDIQKGLSSFRLPARFEQLNPKPDLQVVIDGAHTPKSMEFCINTFLTLYQPGGILLFGCAAGKSAASMAQLLIPHFSAIIITAPGSFKKSNSSETYSLFTEEAGKKSNAVALTHIPHTQSAIEQALLLAEKGKLPVLCAGSFYLAAEIRSYISQCYGGNAVSPFFPA